MWEKIEDGVNKTERMKVPNGWLVRSFTPTFGHNYYNIAMTFVPDPSHLWDIEKEKKD